MRPVTRTGIYLALTTAVISGFSIYLNKFAVKAVDDVLLFTTLKNSVVGLALTGSVVVGLRQWRASCRSSTAAGTLRQWLGLAGLAVIGGSLPFLLFFEGLSQASAPSAALIHKSLFLWVALLAVPLLGERPGGWTVAGLGLLAIGQLLSGWPKAWGWGSGENLILLAALLWAGETILARRLLPGLPTALAAAARMAGGAAVMWLYLLATDQAGGVWTLSVTQWSWVVVTSALLLGYVTTWYAALKRAPATIVTSVLTIGAVITAGLNVALEGGALAAGQLIGLLIVGAGVALMIGILLIGKREHARLTA